MLSTVVAFILVVGCLVFIHELGHYLAARHVGVRVERFSIGFPPRAFGRWFGETEWVLSWIPLGGYVRLYGQNIDDEDPSDPHNYAAKSKLQRAYILAAGPGMNFVAALLLMATVYMLGVESPAYRYSPPRLAAVEAGSPAEAAGFRPGDRIVALQGRQIESWKALFDTIERDAIRTDQLDFQVARGDGTAELTVSPSAFIGGQAFGWTPVVPARVGRFGPDSPAAEGGMRTGDLIVAVDDTPVNTWNEVPGLIQSSKGRPLRITVERGAAAQAERVTLSVTPRMDANTGHWMIQIAPGMHTERYGPVDAFALGGQRLWSLTESTFVFLGRLVTGRGSMDALGGPVKIGMVIGEAARTNAESVIFLMAFISLQLGILNLLPIPALDGGHIFMLGVEAVNRGPLSPQIRERTQMVGFSLLILLILFVTYNDVAQLLTGGKS